MAQAARYWICVGPVLISVADVILTFCGQPAAYWSGRYWLVREDNPLASWLLTAHPAAFLIGNLIWICCVVLAVLLLPFRAARFVAMVVLLGQAAAVSTWLLRLPFGIAWVVLLFLGVRLFVDKRLLRNTFRSEEQRGYTTPDS